MISFLTTLLVLVPLLVAVADDEPKPFRLGATKAWALGSREQKEIKRNRDGDWKLDDKTECLSGNDLYESKRVFCDAVRSPLPPPRAPLAGMRPRKRQKRTLFVSRPFCARHSVVGNGPWYCSKTEVCQQFDRPVGHTRNDQLPCVARLPGVCELSPLSFFRRRRECVVVR